MRREQRSQGLQSPVLAIGYLSSNIWLRFLADVMPSMIQPAFAQFRGVNLIRAKPQYHLTNLLTLLGVTSAKLAQTDVAIELSYYTSTSLISLSALVCSGHPSILSIPTPDEVQVGW